MIEWLQHFWATMTWMSVFIGILLFVVTFVVSYSAVCVVLIKLPANYFHSDYEHHLLPNSHPVLRSVAIGAKNVLGVILILTGIVLAFPGVPGPGLLTIFIGVMLTDFPGKRKLEAMLIGRPSVLDAINKLRSKYKKPPLLLE
jgi:hypothetical protein